MVCFCVISYDTQLVIGLRELYGMFSLFVLSLMIHGL